MALNLLSNFFHVVLHAHLLNATCENLPTMMVRKRFCFFYYSVSFLLLPLFVVVGEIWSVRNLRQTRVSIKAINYGYMTMTSGMIIYQQTMLHHHSLKGTSANCSRAWIFILGRKVFHRHMAAVGTKSNSTSKSINLLPLFKNLLLGKTFSEVIRVCLRHPGDNRFIVNANPFSFDDQLSARISRRRAWIEDIFFEYLMCE